MAQEIKQLVRHATSRSGILNHTRRWVTAQDGLENLRLSYSAMPVPKEGEVLVKVSAVSLNYRDTEGEHSSRPA
jgi:hypothetical protein